MVVDSKRIAKNSLLLYIRMIVLMLVALYTSRIVLSALGVEDFGLYNVVGGVVVVLSFLNGTLSTASSRYIVVAFGEGDRQRMQLVFSNVFIMNALLAVIVFTLAETIGLWFLNNKMQIPADRFHAVSWVYQISIVTVIVNILSVPYNALIIAHERMKAFAYISLLDAFGKLAIAYVLQVILFDRLIAYALLLLLIQILDRVVYTWYSLTNFDETRMKLKIDKKLCRNMLGFISWSSYGSFVSVGFTQGLNILLNLFFDPFVNAARGIAVQVQNNVVAFTNNFQMALNPQLMMATSQKQYADAQKIFISGSKFSFYMLCAIGIPIIAETHIIIDFWLGVEPDYVIPFCRIILITSVFGCLAAPLRIVNQAEGNIKKFQLYECTTLLTIVPLSYICLCIWELPIIVFCVHFIIEMIAQFIRLKIVLPKIQLSIGQYMKQIYLRIIPVFIFPVCIAILINNILQESFVRFVLNCCLIEISVMVLVYFIGLTTMEREYVLSLLKHKLRLNEKDTKYF